MYIFKLMIGTFTVLQKPFCAISPRFDLPLRELPSDFQVQFFLSRRSFLFPILIYRCFVTLFSTSIFHCNFER